MEPQKLEENYKILRNVLGFKALHYVEVLQKVGS